VSNVSDGSEKVKSRVKKTIVLGLIAAVVATVVIGATPAFAAPGTANGTRLENLLKREQIVLTNQTDRLALSDKVVAKGQEWIDALKGRGKDVTALQAALDAYETAGQKAAVDLGTAKAALAAHAGFDAGGNAIDASQALQTLVSAGKAERQYHLTITPAAIALREAVLAYRQANK
jgi:hypothetical protein